MDSLQDALLRAHEGDDIPALITLYTQAADLREAAGDIDAACFYLTHAFVFALQAGVADAQVLQHRLWKHGRDVAPSGLD